MSTKFLFLLKKRALNSTDPNSWNYVYSSTPSSGLFNSVKFIVKLLSGFGVDAVMKEVVDGNSVDREIITEKANVVIIEAIWVTPEKLRELVKLHPDVTFIVRLHSELPFIASEGTSMAWITEYAKMWPNVRIGANSERMSDDLNKLHKVHIHEVPNWYDMDCGAFKHRDLTPDIIDVSCFGAIRPLKNHLAQAVAAIQFADEKGLKLRFHINASRKEGDKANNILKNLESLFADHTHHELVMHDWLTHEDFVKMIAAEIDIGMQVSFSETYNIVTADHIACEVPIVTSHEIELGSHWLRAEPTSVSSMVTALKRAVWYKRMGLTWFDKQRLGTINDEASEKWMKFVREFEDHHHHRKFR